MIPKKSIWHYLGTHSVCQYHISPERCSKKNCFNMTYYITSPKLMLLTLVAKEWLAQPSTGQAPPWSLKAPQTKCYDLIFSKVTWNYPLVGLGCLLMVWNRGKIHSESNMSLPHILARLNWTGSWPSIGIVTLTSYGVSRVLLPENWK